MLTMHIQKPIKQTSYRLMSFSLSCFYWLVSANFNVNLESNCHFEVEVGSKLQVQYGRVQSSMGY